MADNPITVNLPADLPEDWVENQIVAPEGQSVGLSQQHGYNYLMEQVNNAQTAANEIGAAFAGLAPGGFGLGTVAVNISDLNDATKNGWYMNGAGGEAVHAPDNVPGWLVLVCACADEIVFQTAYRYGSDKGLISARRAHHYLFGGWHPWEWINPPMQLGVEYRTTERYSNKPVFVMAVNGGGFPNSSSKKIDVQIPDTSGQVKMLDCYGVLDNGTQIPGLFGESVFDASNYLGLFTQNGNGKFTISVGSGRTVGLNFTLFLKYWKEGT